MTICIAGIAENKKIVAITDKMLTITAGAATKYEISDSHKAIKLTDKTVALFAGDVIHANTVLEIAKAKIANQTPTTVEEIAKLVTDAYKERWQSLLTEHFFGRYNLTIDVFVANQAKFDPDLVKQGNKILGEYDLGLQIIVAGIDDKPHVYSIGNPAAMNSSDSLGYSCIGSGSQHASLSLIESSYHSGMKEPEAIHALIEAKRRAEFDPGVGTLCDVVLIGDSQSNVSDATIREVMGDYSKSKEEIEKIEKACAEGMHKKFYAK